MLDLHILWWPFGQWINDLNSDQTILTRKKLSWLIRQHWLWPNYVDWPTYLDWSGNIDCGQTILTVTKLSWLTNPSWLWPNYLDCDEIILLMTNNFNCLWAGSYLVYDYVDLFYQLFGTLSWVAVLIVFVMEQLMCSSWILATNNTSQKIMLLGYNRKINQEAMGITVYEGHVWNSSRVLFISMEREEEEDNT